MIELVCNDLKDKIAPLPFSEKVGGLSQIAVKYVESTLEDGTKVKIDELKFPVSSNISGKECANINSLSTYGDLCPNSNKMSVIYFEQLSDTEEYCDMKNVITSKVDLRCVVWLSLNKLGIDINSKALAVGTIENQLKFLLTTKGSNALGSYNTCAKAVSRNVEIFSKYSYSKSVIENLMLYPFAFFAIDFVATWKSQASCFTFTPQTPITC